MDQEIQEKLDKLVNLGKRLVTNINNLQSPGNFQLPSMKEIKINIIMITCNQSREEATAYINKVKTPQWDNYINQEINAISAELPVVYGLKDIAQGIVTNFVSSQTSAATATGQAATIPVVTSSGAGTANAAMFNTSIQKQMVSQAKASTKNVKATLISVAKSLANIIMKTSILMLFDLITPLENLLSIVNSALELYNSMPFK